MSEYHKIDSMFKRDGKRLMIDELDWARPEFGYLADNEWMFTEKVDGTNIRLYYGDPDMVGNEHAYVSGRTDNAQLPPALLNRCVELLKTMPLDEQFPSATAQSQVVLYGEGYGKGIQSGGKYLRDRVDFVLFDVQVGDWMLSRANVEDVANGLGIDVVQVVDTGTLHDAIKLARDGFRSSWPGVDVPEGLVVRPLTDLWDLMGRRIITKIKHKDFR